MDPLLPLLFFLIFFLVTQLPALVVRLVSRAAETPERERHVRNLIEHRRQLVRPISERHEHPREKVMPEAASLEAIPRRIPLFEEVRPHLPISLESIEERHPAPPPPTRGIPTPLRTRRVHRPIDMRRAIVLGALLGRPRGMDPELVFPREP